MADGADGFDGLEETRNFDADHENERSFDEDLETVMTALFGNDGENSFVTTMRNLLRRMRLNMPARGDVEKIANDYGDYCDAREKTACVDKIMRRLPQLLAGKSRPMPSPEEAPYALEAAHTDSSAPLSAIHSGFLARFTNITKSYVLDPIRSILSQI